MVINLWMIHDSYVIKFGNVVNTSVYTDRNKKSVSFLKVPRIP